MRSLLSRSLRQRCRTAAVVLIASLVAGTGCVDSPVARPIALPAGGVSLAAGLELDRASAALSWSTGPTWSLSKTGGALSGSVVTWTIVATEGPVAPGPLVVKGNRGRQVLCAPEPWTSCSCRFSRRLAQERGTLVRDREAPVAILPSCHSPERDYIPYPLAE